MSKKIYLKDGTPLKLFSVIDKCRVAPINIMTTPKLEKSDAVYGVRLKRQTSKNNDVKIDQSFNWTVSSTVLQWLQCAHKKQQTFVANRTAAILEDSSIDHLGT